ncbi:MAG: hypothetical protein VCA36_13670 [Opitutales bacterium]
MHSIPKTLFHVVGIFCLLMTALLWFAALGEVALLNNLIDKLSNLRFAGYGLDIIDQEQRRVTVALVGSGAGAYLTASFFAIGWMDGSIKALKMFSAFTGCLLGFVFCGLWVKFLGDDHLLTTSDKMELLGLSMFLGLGTIALCWLGFSNRSSQSFAKAAPASKRPLIEAETSPEPTDATDIPSVESLLEDESSPEGEEETASDAGKPEDEAPPPVLEPKEEVAQAEDLAEESPERPKTEEPDPAPSVQDSMPDPISTVDSDISPSQVPPPTVEETALPLLVEDSEPPPSLPANSEEVAPALPSVESASSSDDTPPPLPPLEDGGDLGAKETNQPA